MKKVKLSPGIERFLRRWERTKGFGLTWTLHKRRQVCTLGWCCPVSALADRPMWDWNEREVLRAAGLKLEDASRIAIAADRRPGWQPAIRRRLLRGVGLSE